MATYLITSDVYHDGVYYEATPNNPAVVVSETQPGGSVEYVAPVAPPSKPFVGGTAVSNIATTSVTLNFTVSGIVGQNARVWVAYKATADLLAQTTGVLGKVGSSAVSGDNSVNLTGLTTGTQYQALIVVLDVDSEPDSCAAAPPLDFTTL